MNTITKSNCSKRNLGYVVQLELTKLGDPKSFVTIFGTNGDRLEMNAWVPIPTPCTIKRKKYITVKEM